MAEEIADSDGNHATNNTTPICSDAEARCGDNRDAQDRTGAALMDIHNPKPVRSWRELFTEMGVIVLSVCIALSAEQGVEWWHWRVQVAEARSVIASEMARNISYGIERLRFARCGQARLRAIKDVLNTANRQGAVPPLGLVGNTILRPWSSGTWDSVVASQAATHFPRQQLASLSLVYKQVQRVENWNRLEAEAWTTLRTMTGPGRRYDPPYDAELRKALGLAQLYNGVISITSERLIESAKSQNLPFTSDERQQMADAMKTPDFSYLCQPVSATSAQGGNEFSEAGLARLDTALKHLP
jgi:hypothetical protein